MTAQVAADLRAAAEVLRRDGWTQGEYHNECGHCVRGSIYLATGVDVRLGDGTIRYAPLSTLQESDRATSAHRALAEQVRHADDLADWNDAPGRTADEVIAALETAAQAAEQQAQPQSGDRP